MRCCVYIRIAIDRYRQYKLKVAVIKTAVKTMISGLTMFCNSSCLLLFKWNFWRIVIHTGKNGTDWPKNVIPTKQFCDETLALSCEQSRKNFFTVGVHTSVVSADVWCLWQNNALQARWSGSNIQSRPKSGTFAILLSRPTTHQSWSSSFRDGKLP